MKPSIKRLHKSAIAINQRSIGPQYPPYIIAELSANHNGDIGRALAILEMAKRSGADAVKLQTYTQDTLTIDCAKSDFLITEGLWKGRTLYDLYSEAHMPWAWHKPLFTRAKELDITIFSSPFDTTAVDYLEDLHCPAYKIASFEAIDLPLIKYVAQTGKPMIISTGMADADEIGEAIATARDNGCQELVVLHCVSGYPAPPQDYHLRTICDMAQQFDVLTGLSDHTLDNTTAITSVALGACVIEKHVTLDRAGGGPDDSFSLEEPELTQLCQNSKTAWQALGQVDYTRKPSEQQNGIFRRSLYVVQDMKAGDEFTHDNVKSIRPGYGLAPKYIDDVLGKVALTKLSKGTPLKLSNITGIA
jgi:N-acetylneuraminate synthase